MRSQGGDDAFPNSSAVCPLLRIPDCRRPDRPGRAEAGSMYRITDLGGVQATGLTNAGQVVAEQGFDPATNSWGGPPQSFTSARRSVFVHDGAITPITDPKTGGSVSG